MTAPIPGWAPGQGPVGHGPATAAPVFHHRDLRREIAWDVTEDVSIGINAWLIRKSVVDSSR